MATDNIGSLRRMPGQYALPAGLLLRLGAGLLRGQRRSFRSDARVCVQRLQPALRVEGDEYIPISGPCLVTVNHYTRPGLRAWWLALAVSAALAVEIHWLIASAWTYPDRLRQATVTPLSRWVLQRLARVYGFTTLPPMPPDPVQVESRARAVRRVLSYVQTVERPVLGLSPEGGDFAAPGQLAVPPPGAGRFILRLCALGLEIAPVGVFEREGGLCLRFGPRYHLQAEPGLLPAARDRWAAHQVMQRIAALLPLRQLPTANRSLITDL